MQKICLLINTIILFVCCYATLVQAHFGMIIPSTNIVTQEQKTQEVDLLFAHPFEAVGMDLTQPQAVSLFANGKTTDLLADLVKKQQLGHEGYRLPLSLTRPGVYQLAMTPTPYWEEMEDLYIIHYTKTYISAFGAEDGWDVPMGLPTEIIPLSRPFANYSGNLFTGKILLNGKVVPHGEVEVEFYNAKQNHLPPTEHHITQVVKADENGVFSFVCPWEGWWGFSALNTAEETMKGPDGSPKGVELGAVLWVYFDAPLYAK